MQRVDAGYLYDLGDTVRCLRHFRVREVRAYEIYTPLVECQQRLTEFLSNSVYTRSLRGMHVHAPGFLKAISALIQRIVDEKMETVTGYDQLAVHAAYDKFEPVLQAELSNQVMYLVLPKGVYDVVALIEDGSQLFPQSLHMKAPEAALDITEGAKSMAFELWTAAAFHFHRANEAVLRRYYDKRAGPNKRPKIETMGTLLKALEEKGLGDKQVIVALQNIKEFHRNPIIHPGQYVDDAEQAFSLVAAIRAAMGYMLDQLDILPFDELMLATPNPNVNDHPLLETEQAH